MDDTFIDFSLDDYDPQLLDLDLLSVEESRCSTPKAVTPPTRIKKRKRERCRRKIISCRFEELKGLVLEKMTAEEKRKLPKRISNAKILELAYKKLQSQISCLQQEKKKNKSLTESFDRMQHMLCHAVLDKQSRAGIYSKTQLVQMAREKISDKMEQFKDNVKALQELQQKYRLLQNKI